MYKNLRDEASNTFNKKMNKYQIRVLRTSLGSDKSKYYHDFKSFDIPFIRKSINDITINGKKIKNKEMCHLYKLWKGTNIYDLYSFEITSSSNLYIITKNDIVIYWTVSNIYAPAINAFHTLTEVYHGYRPDIAVYQWKSVEPFECADMLLVELTRKSWNNPEMKQYHSEYQNKKFKETSLQFIDFTIITSEEAELLVSKLNHNY